MQLTNDDTDHYEPDISPAGNALTYCANDSNGNYQIYLLTGSGTFQLTSGNTNHYDPDWGTG